jgi:hypothetical protein
MAGGAAEKLAVHPRTFMGFRGDDMQSSEVQNLWVKADIRAASCHICSDGNA